MASSLKYFKMMNKTQLAIEKFKATLQDLYNQSPCPLFEQVVDKRIGDYEISVSHGEDYVVLAIAEITEGHRRDVMDICLLVQDGEIQTMSASNLKLSSNLISACDVDCEVAKKYSLAERIVMMYAQQ